MNQDWKIINLGKICDVLDSKRKPITKRDRIPGDYPYYGATGIVDWVNDYIFDEQLILLGEDGAKWDSGERSAFNINGKTWVNNHAHVLRPHRDVVKDNWLVYYLNHQSLLPFITGLTVPKLNQGKMRGIPILVPPLPEQKRIVTKLDQCFEAIDKARANVERNLQNAKELFQSQLNQIFSQKGEGWVEKKLIDVNKFIDYRGRTPKKVPDGIRLITAKNVRMGYLKAEPQEFINPNDYDSWMTRGIPQKNDVLFTTEAPLANVALLDTDEKIALAQRIITFSPNRELLTGEYLHYCLQSKELQGKILSKATGATVSGIKSRLLKEITIFLPRLGIQEQIVNKLDHIKAQTQSLESNYQQELDALDELKKSILEKAFNGEL